MNFNTNCEVWIVGHAIDANCIYTRKGIVQVKFHDTKELLKYVDIGKFESKADPRDFDGKTVWRKGSCLKCNGDMYLDQDEYGVWYWECLACSNVKYEDKLNSKDEH